MDNDRYDDGVAMRQTVLGEDHVQRSITNANEFSKPMQDLVTEYCWGAVWTRPALGLRERSLINLAMLTALNRPEELELHVHGALNNGCSPQEIQEVLLQAAVYCGVPAGMTAFRVARAVVDQRQGADGDGRVPEER